MKNRNDLFLWLYLAGNGMAVGAMLKLIKYACDRGLDDDTAGAIIVTGGAILLSADRIRTILRDKRNQNQK